jgi:formylglycine-generating enzyme required for sulfatase activity
MGGLVDGGNRDASQDGSSTTMGGAGGNAGSGGAGAGGMSGSGGQAGSAGATDGGPGGGGAGGVSGAGGKSGAGGVSGAGGGDAGCTAESDTTFCTRLGKNCGMVSGTDNCGRARTVPSCGTCAAPFTCAANGTANVCECRAESDGALCTRLGKNCGTLTATDNCNMTRTVASCGTCAPASGAFPAASCGGAGANVCGCPGTTVSGWACINPGSFREDDGANPHQVTIGGPFWMKATEVTQGDYQSVMGNNPSTYTTCGSSCPVEHVSWFMAIAYANALSSRDGIPPCYTKAGGTNYTATDAAAFIDPVWSSGVLCRAYRLPTEAEWEYATRAGTTTALYNGPITVNGCSPLDPNMDAAGWYCGNTMTGPHPVGLKLRNPWGLYDTLGNVLEWVWDWNGTYPSTAVVDPIGPTSGPGRGTRGGTFAVGGPQYCSCGFRNWDDPKTGTGNGGAGIRVVRAFR